MWEQYDKFDKELEELTAKLESIKVAQSDALKVILAENKGEKLITRDGVLYTIMKREEHCYLRTGKAGRPKKSI